MIRFVPAAAGALLAGFSLAACEAPAPEAAVEFTPDVQAADIENHIRFLASDELGGRDAGSEGYAIAAQYVADRYAELGLVPAGDDGYFADVPLQDVMLDADNSSLEIDGEVFAHGQGVMIGSNPIIHQAEVTGRLVYVGYGVSAPDRGHDDYADIDVDGAIVVMRGGIPEIFPSDERAHHQSGSTKRDLAAANGAVGMIQIAGWSDEQIAGFAANFGGRSSTRLTGATGPSSYEQVQASATVGASLAERLFANGEMSLEEIRAAENAEENPTHPRLELNQTITLRQSTLSEGFTDVNVVGMIEGSDPELAEEVVVLTAHLDHIGRIQDTMRAGGACRASLDEDQDNDLICNGALDNASGIAIMLETAKTFLAQGAPRRSVLFVALAAEEKGLLGSEHFARNPTVDANRLVANVNLDMPIITYEFSDVIAFGSEHSNLGPIAARGTERLGVTISEDPIPDQNLFVRSDHYSFVREGVPSLFLVTGFSSPDPRWDQGEGFMGFLNTYYHRADDQLGGEMQVLFDQGAKFANINYIIAREIADADERPRWNEDSFFGNQFGR